MSMNMKRIAAKLQGFRACYGFALFAALCSAPLFAAEAHQPGEVVIEPATVTTVDGRTIQYEVGTLYVPENRSAPNSRVIAVGFARIKAAGPTGAPPTFHLPGGPGNTILDLIANPREAPRFLQYLAVGDVVLVEQRGYTSRGEKLQIPPTNYPPQPLSQPSSLAAWNQEAVETARTAAAEYSAKGIDLAGYTVLECADDVDDLRRALGYRKITLVGHSFGTQWGFAIMRRHPQIVERALLSGVVTLGNAYDMPSHVFAALQRIAWDFNQDPQVQPYLPPDGSGLIGAVREIMTRVRQAPISVPLTNPQTGQTETIVLGVEDFQILLNVSSAFSSDDLPQLILAVYNGRYEEWAGLIRDLRLRGIVRFVGNNRPLIAWLIGSSLGVTAARNHQLHTDPALEFWGTWTTDPVIASAEFWPSKDVGDDFRTPRLDRTPVLFIQGDWDTSTPLENTLGIQRYFPNSHALIVHRGTHGARGDIERSMPDVMNKVLEFLRSGRMEQLPTDVELPASQPEMTAASGKARRSRAKEKQQ